MSSTATNGRRRGGGQAFGPPAVGLVAGQAPLDATPDSRLTAAPADGTRAHAPASAGARAGGRARERERGRAIRDLQQAAGGYVAVRERLAERAADLRDEVDRVSVLLTTEEVAGVLALAGVQPRELPPAEQTHPL